MNDGLCCNGDLNLFHNPFDLNGICRFLWITFRDLYLIIYFSSVNKEIIFIYRFIDINYLISLKENFPIF